MGLMITNERTVFDTSLVKKGDLMRVAYCGWCEPKNGIVTHVSEDRIVLLHSPDIANVSMRLVLFARDVAKGGYHIYWTSDFSDRHEYPEEQETDQQIPPS